jgi:hypothetical protein
MTTYYKTTYYKVLGKNRMPYHGGRGQWPYRKWTEPIPNPVPCQRGYHVVTAEQLPGWLGPEIWVVEPGGVLIDGGDKFVTDRARLVRKTKWNERSARLFAADCAEHVLPLAREGDRPVLAETLRVVRAYAIGEATPRELAAARAAAWAAAGAAWATGDATGDAARAVGDAAWAARDAAGAARDAAEAAAGAAGAAAGAWQSERLVAYLGGTV